MTGVLKGKVVTDKTIVEGKLSDDINVSKFVNDADYGTNGRIDEVEAQMQSDVSRLDGEVSRLDGEVSRLDGKIEAAESGLEDRIEELDDKVDGQVVRLDQKIEKAEEDLTEKIEGIEASLTAKIGETENELTEKIEGVETDLTGKIGHVETELTAKIGEVEAELTEKVEEVETELTGKIGEAKTELNAKVDAEVSRLDGKIDTAAGDLTTKIEEVESDLTGKIESAEASLVTKIDETDEHLRELIDGTNSSLKSRIEDAKSEFAQKLQESEADLKIQIHEVEAGLTENIEALNGKVDTEVGNLNDRVSDIQLNIGELGVDVTHLNGVFENLYDDVQLLKVEDLRLDGKIDALQTSLSGELDEKIDTLSGAVSANYAEFGTFKIEAGGRLEAIESGMDDIRDDVADNTSAIGRLSEDFINTQKFKGYFDNNSDVESIQGESGAYAWSAESGTVWVYENDAWENTGVKVPDQTVPASEVMPSMDDNTAKVGIATSYARADHVHPTDTSRAAASDLNNYLPLAGNTQASGMSGDIWLGGNSIRFSAAGSGELYYAGIDNGVVFDCSMITQGLNIKTNRAGEYSSQLRYNGVEVATRDNIPTTLPPSGAAGGDLAGSYPNPTIGAGKVDSVKIADLAITEGKLAANSVSAAKIAAGAIIEAKIGAGAVTADKLGANAVTTVKIADSAVTTAKLATGSVTAAKLGADLAFVKEMKSVELNPTSAGVVNIGEVPTKILMVFYERALLLSTDYSVSGQNLTITSSDVPVATTDVVKVLYY